MARRELLCGALLGIVAGLSPLLAHATPVVWPLRPVPRGELPFIHFGTEIGLGELGAYEVAEDSKGALWIAGETGVFRYDGRHVIHYGAGSGLPAPYVLQIAVAHDDVVFCATTGGLGRFQRGLWSAVWETSPGLGLESVRQMAVSGEGLLWVTTSKGVAREQRDGSFAIDPSFPTEDVGAVAFADDGAALVGGRGTLYVENADGTRATYQDGLHGERIFHAIRDRRGRTWVVTSSGIRLLRPGEQQFRGPYASPLGADTTMTLDPKGAPWFASEFGLFYADDNDGIEHAAGLPNEFINGTYFDREGSLWALGFGIYRLAGRGLFRNYTETNGLPNNTVWSINRVFGELWVGTSKGVARAGERGFTVIPEIPPLAIRSIVPLADGHVWMSGPVGKVYRFDVNSRKLDTYGTREGLPDARTLALHVDSRGTVWVGTNEGGLVRSTGAGDSVRFERFQSEAGDIGPSARDIVADNEGQLWVTTDRGLLRIADERQRLFTTADGLRETSLGYALVRRSGELCVAYRLAAGVDCFATENGVLRRVMRFDTTMGLSSDIVYTLGEDAEGTLFIGTNAGLNRWDGRSLVRFDVEDGLPSYDCDARAFAADSSGDTWVGTSRGLTRFIGAEYRGLPPPPAVALEAVHEQKDGTTLQFLPNAQLPAGGGALEFQFAAKSYLHEPAMLYETRLRGASLDWQTAKGDKRRYDSLAPASYVFEVRARHPGGEWGNVAALPFTVSPLFFQTGWFRALGAAFALVLFGGGIMLRSAALRSRNRELRALVDERTRALATAQAAVSRAERLSALGRVLAHLSHELNNPMNVVRNNVAPLREYVETMVATLRSVREQTRKLEDGGASVDTLWKKAEIDFIAEDAKAALGVIEKSAERVSVIQSDLSAFLRGDEGDRKVGDLSRELTETVELLRRGLAPGVTIDATYEPLPEVRYDAGRMNQVFLNLLQNAIQAVGDSGTVTVRSWTEGGNVCVQVRDSGVGVPDSVRDRIFEPFFSTKPVGKGTGLGLSICRQIVVEQHGGTLELAENDPESTSHGACFILRLPAFMAARVNSGD